MRKILNNFSVCFFCYTFIAYSSNTVSVTDTIELTSSNLPIVIINTDGEEIVDSIRIDADMGIIDNGNGQINYIDDYWNNYDGKIAIELRGNLTMWYPKKQYRFETQDSIGENLNVSLLDMPPENDWILNGPYDDQSLIRNVLAYKLSNEMGRYASRTRYCEMVLNGIYQGIYILLEKIKRDRHRVDIYSMDNFDITGDAVTGGYIIKIDKESGENVDGWTSAKDIQYQYDYPKPRDIVAEQENYIQNYIDEFEAVMDGDDYNDPVNGYAKYIDVPSFVDHCILNEFCKNVDAYRISFFMHKDRDSMGGKLQAGPAWDFNLSLGKAFYPCDMFVTEGWQVNYDTTHPDDEYKVPFWWEKLGADSLFSRNVKIRWQELRNEIIQTDGLFGAIDSLADYLYEAGERNFKRWPESCENHTYEEEIQTLKDWISGRIEWMDNELYIVVPIQPVSKNVKIEDSFSLLPNSATPFNPVKRIRFGLSKASPVKIEIYAISGKKVNTLLDSRKDAGYHVVEFGAASLPSGIFFCKIQTDFYSHVKKIKLLK